MIIETMTTTVDGTVEEE